MKKILILLVFILSSCNEYHYHVKQEIQEGFFESSNPVLATLVWQHTLYGYTDIIWSRHDELKGNIDSLRCSRYKQAKREIDKYRIIEVKIKCK